MPSLAIPFVRRTRSRTGWIGVDLGSQCLKLAQLEYQGGRAQIAAASIIPVPEGRFDAARADWLTTTLQERLTRRHGFQGRTAACALSMSIAECRSMNIPPGSPHERRQMIALELAEVGASGGAVGVGEGISFDYWDAWPVPGDTNTSASVLSISEKLTTQVADALYRAGLNCPVLDGGPFPLARSAELVADVSLGGQTVAVLDWGHRSVQFAVVVNGQPAFSRILKDCGAGLLAAAVIKSLDLTIEESQQLLTGCGLPHPRADLHPVTELQALVADSAGEPFNKLVAEVDKTLSYLRTQREELVPAKIWLAGGGATIRHAAERLGFETGINVIPWRLPRGGNAGDLQVQELLAQAAALSALAWNS